MRELTTRIELDLQSSPERLWPLVSDTNRFNRDAGVPRVQSDGVGVNARRRLRLSRLGVRVAWEEQPFEWVRPRRFSVERRYARGPLDSMSVTAELEAAPGGGTLLTYVVRARPRSLLWYPAAAFEIGVVRRRRFERVFRRYDTAHDPGAAAGQGAGARAPRLPPGARRRITAAASRLVEQGDDSRVVAELAGLVARGDELSVVRIRPYVLGDGWGMPRRALLELCLRATRAGLLELRWDLLCPLCRGAAASEATLGRVNARSHCETCLIDFEVSLERSVEVTFRPAAAIRELSDVAYCVAGPQVTPQVVAQQLLSPAEDRSLRPSLEAGAYRLRALGVAGALPVEVSPTGAPDAVVRLDDEGWSTEPVRLAESCVLRLENASAHERLLVLERTAWSDLAATAADVTTLQTFRDLFAAEAIRPGEPVSVGTLTIVFTDLRGSTRYYREIGDAPAFGFVVEHLAVLRDAVAAEGGAVVKTMGDAIMAVFPRPVGAVRAMLAAQGEVAGGPLALKVGIHAGPCIAINQGGALDYFGSTVNLAARLEGLSTGDDLVVSDAVLSDPEVAALGLRPEPVDAAVKGFEGEEIVGLWRVRG